MRKIAAVALWKRGDGCQNGGMRISLAILALSLPLLAGCSPVTLPRMLPASPSSAAAGPSLDDICLAWRKALDGYDAAGERRRLADTLRARGEDPSRCEGRDKAVPLSPSVAPAPAQVAEPARRGAVQRSSRETQRSSSRPTIKSTLSCTSELVKDRYKTICR